MARKINEEHLIYSYATHSSDKNLKEYYENHTKELIAIGDYMYGLLSGIYAKYRVNTVTHEKKSHLKLIVCNDK